MGKILKVELFIHLSGVMLNTLLDQQFENRFTRHIDLLSHLKQSISISDLPQDIENFASEIYACRSRDDTWSIVETLRQFADVLKESVCVLYPFLW